MKHFEKFAHPEPIREKTYSIENWSSIEKPYPMYAEDLVPSVEPEIPEYLIRSENPLYVKLGKEFLDLSPKKTEDNAAKKPKKNSRRSPAKASKRSHKI